MTHISPISVKDRSTLPAFPRGWYCVAETENVSKDEMVPVHYLNRHLIVYRTADGAAQVADAFCPHLGAHLASHDGKIENGVITCPFHKWSFEGQSGKCLKIPYTEKIPPKAQLTLYPTKEVNGMIFLYFSEMGNEPDMDMFEIQDLDSANWSLYKSRSWDLLAPAQEFLENIFDPAHITELHGAHEFPDLEQIIDTDYGMQIDFAIGGQEDFGMEGMKVYYSGLSYSAVNFLGTEFETWNLATFTPVDEESTALTARVYVKETDNKDLDDLVGKGFSDRFFMEVEQDLNVLNFKKHLPKPLLCGGDGPIMKFREYARRYH